MDQTYELVQQFTQMLRTRTGEQLDDWLTHVRTSKIRELQGFVAGVGRDKEAVKAGLTLPFSNGIVEGNVNKLKLVKRMETPLCWTTPLPSSWLGCSPITPNTVLAFLGST